MRDDKGKFVPVYNDGLTRGQRHRLRHRERLLEKRREEYAANPEKFRKQSVKHYAKNSEKSIAANKQWRAANPEKCRVIGRRARNPEKERIRYQVRKALRNGLLVKQPCEVCGEVKSQAHHHDYSKPLDVRWLCQKHHSREHVKHEEFYATTA